MKRDKAMVLHEDSSALKPVTPEQERAIALMVQGKTVKDAATEIGVNRATLFRWMRHDPSFVAAWNAWRREQHQAVRAQLLGLAGSAVTAVRDAIEGGDGRLGLSLLKAIGMVSAERPGSEEPETVRREIELARRKEEVGLKRGEGDIMMEEMLAG